MIKPGRLFSFTNRGFVMLPVVITLLIVALLAFVMNRESGMNAAAIGDQADIEQARLVAEAGLQHATWDVNNKACTGYTLASTAFGAHAYSASYTPTSGSPVSISATGNHASGITRTLTKTSQQVFDTPITTVLQPGAADAKDTWLYMWKSGWNYGVDASIWVSNEWSDSLAYSLLQFDLSAIPANATIISATLELRQNLPSAKGGTVGIHRMTSDWDEGIKSGANGASNWTEKSSGVAWASSGGDFDASTYASTVIPTGTTGWFSWEISSLVSDWTTGLHDNFGLIAMPESPSTAVYFDSSDNTTSSNHPKLTITYACECGVVCSGGGGGVGVVYEEFTEAKLGSAAGTSLTINKPAGTAAGDLLIAAVATDGSTKNSLALSGWNIIDIEDNGSAVTLGVWWKLAGGSEPANYSFTWSGSEEAYGMLMRFTGHDAVNPINVSASSEGASSSPTSPAVTTTVANTLVLRLGGFDDDDVTFDSTGLSAHTDISMDASGTGNFSTSGGAGYVVQPAAGDSGTANFSLTASEEYRAVTIGIAPQ